MDDMVQVRALRPHRNDYGESRSKAKGDIYAAPAHAVGSLVASGWVARVKAPRKQAAA